MSGDISGCHTGGGECYRHLVGRGHRCCWTEPTAETSGLRCQQCRSWDFPVGPVVKNPPSNAGDAGSIPGWGTKIPHAAGQLSLRATTTGPSRLNQRAACCKTTEPTCSGVHVPQLERENLHATTREKPTHRNQREAHMLQLERSPHASMKRSRVLQLRPDAAINK